MRQPSLLVALALLTSITACCPSGGKTYTGSVSIPESFGPLRLDTYHSIGLAIFDGGRKPMGVDNVSASCEDASICRTEIRKTADWPILDIIPLKVGKTTVVIKWHHPVRNADEQHRAAVVVEPGQPIPTLAMNAAVPATPFDVPARGKRPAGRCTPHDNLTIAKVITGAKTPTTRLFECLQRREITKGDLRAPNACSGMESCDKFALCAQLSGGSVTSISGYEEIADNTLPEKDRFKEVDREGAPGPGPCSVVK